MVMGSTHGLMEESLLETTPTTKWMEKASLFGPMGGLTKVRSLGGFGLNFKWLGNKLRVKFIGNYVNDIKEGHGVYTWPDGKK